MSDAPFSSFPIDLDCASLTRLDDVSAATLAAGCAAIDPWARMDYPAETLKRYLLRSEPGARRCAILAGGRLAGCVVVRHPWLKGPYLEFLAILPPFQDHGIGGAVLGWMEAEVSGSDRNLWVLASDFNTRALAFYQGRGFEPVAPLPNAATDGFTEILLRKRLDGARGRVPG